MTIQFLNPVQDAEADPATLAPRLSSLDGATLGILPNAKENAGRLLDYVAEELDAQFALKGLVKMDTIHAGINCPPEILDDLVSQVDAVVTALGD